MKVRETRAPLNLPQDENVGRWGREIIPFPLPRYIRVATAPRSYPSSYFFTIFFFLIGGLGNGELRQGQGRRRRRRRRRRRSFDSARGSIMGE